MQPRWIPVLQALRGVLGPLDEHTANDPKVHEAIRLADDGGAGPRHCAPGLADPPDKREASPSGLRNSDK